MESLALIVIDEPEDNVVRATRNLVGVKTMSANLLNVVDLLSCRMLLMNIAAVRKVEQLWGQRLARGEVNAPV